MGEWIAGNWFNLVQTASILALGILNVVEYRQDRRGRKLSNLTELIKGHREIWREYSGNPHLGRIKHVDVDLEREPISREEATFVRLVIAHANGAFVANALGESVGPQNSGMDIAQFLSFPIPNTVWNQIKVLQDSEFFNFVEAARARLESQ